MPGSPSVRGSARCPPRAQCGAPVDDEIPRFEGIAADPVFEDGRVRSPCDIANVLVVPVRQEHDDDLQAVQLARADERIVVPRPAVLVEMLDDARLIELEARIAKAAVFANALMRTLKAGCTFDGAGRHKVVHLYEVSGGPRHARGKYLRVHFVAPFHPPSPFTRIADRYARKAARRMLFDESERRSGCPVVASRPRGEVQALGRAGIAPDDRTSRSERRVAGGTPPQSGAHAPEREDQPDHDDRTDRYPDENLNEICRRHSF